ncbi:MAG: clostripain-related cysteine peptidase [Eubacteriales bacterium]
MFCINCGDSMPDSAKFCPSCGAPTQPAAPKEESWEQGAPSYDTPPQTTNKDPWEQGAPSYHIPTKPAKKKMGLGWKILIVLVLVGILVPVLLFGCAVFWLMEEEKAPGNGSAQSEWSDFWEEDEPFVVEGVTAQELELTDLRDYYTTVQGDGTDQITLMVYLLGSDLESDGGYASNDLQEMMDASFSDNLNLIVMTGGASSWSNRQISSETCQYWQVKDGALVSIDDDLGLLDMTDEDTLTAFIGDATTMYPANRYGLILWDHGGGTFCGYGYDEHYTDGEMDLAEIGDALEASALKFDFVGFDACLMGTMETAVMLEPYADYMIASEEMEDATGWYYTSFLEAWSNDPSMDTVDMAKILIDTFVEKNVEEYRRTESTLSIVDLREIPYTYSLLVDYFTGVELTTDASNYTVLSSALSNAKSYGEGDYEQVDVVDFVTILNLNGAQDVVNAVGSAVKYYCNSDSIADTYGLAMYFPYVYPDYYAETSEVMLDIGFDTDYIDFLSSFVSASAGTYSQYVGDGSSSGGGSQGGGSQGGGPGGGSQGMMQQGGGPGGGQWGFEQDYSEENWYDSDIADSYCDWYDSSTYDSLEIVLKGDEYVLQLTDAQWEDIVTLELQVLLDDGNQYVDLGSDNVYEFDDDGDLLVAFDYTWVTLDGHTVPFYFEYEFYENDDNWFTYGTVPAILNGSDYVELLIYWDSDEPEGYVTGYRKFSAAGDPVGKGSFLLEKGDTLDWLFDFYDYDLYYTDSGYYGSTYTYGGREIEVSYDDVGDPDALAYFVLTDIYNHSYTSEAVIYTDY